MKARLAKKYFGYKAIAIACALLSPLSTPLWEGTNTGEDHCIYTSEEAANWHFMGMPCTLTAEGIGSLAIGYLFTFLLLFLVLGGFRFFAVKIAAKTSPCYQTAKKYAQSAEMRRQTRENIATTLRPLWVFFLKAPPRIKLFSLLTVLYAGALGGFVLYGAVFETKAILFIVSGLSLIFSLLFWLNVLGCYLCIRYTRKLYRHGGDIGAISFYIDAGFILGYCTIILAASYFLLNVNWGDL